MTVLLEGDREWSVFAMGPRGDLTPDEKQLAKASARWHRSRAVERQDADATFEAIRRAVAAGTSESRAAEIAGVDRGTVRRAVGKPRG